MQKSRIPLSHTPSLDNSLLKTTVIICLAPLLALHAQIQQESGNLLALALTLRNNLPAANSEGFLQPTVDDLALWRSLTSGLIAQQWQRVDSLIQVALPEYELIAYTDTGFESRAYYLLREKTPIRKGWGTVIVNPAFERQLCVEIPHPRHDTNTHTEGMDIFRRTSARFLLMAGTHRCANAEVSPCDGTSSACGDGRYHVSDVAHNDFTPFHVVHGTIERTLANVYSLSVHGNSSSECEDIFLSNGHRSQSQPLLYDLKADLLAAGGITVAVAGDGTSNCSFIGSTNVQGRFSNGETAPCNEAASSTTGYFIHIEQRRSVRDDFSVYLKLIDALNQTLATVTSVSQPSSSPASSPPKNLRLFPSYPNPVRERGTFSYALQVAANVTAGVYNLQGQLVRWLQQEQPVSPGRHDLVWDGKDGNGSALPSGTYFIKIRAGQETASLSVTLAK